ncbi:MAG TPA: BTAD domain-containing putative transcriptional regulator [Pyrinomonadaceae bacterium]|nr:BTAD domain-containing putative transcriptional regulator [Pyrinomonadaceae bacterium]
MSDLRFQLFGKFTAELDGSPLKGLDASKEQELLSYLLVARGRRHSRESLASLLWGEVPTSKSKKYLRQALWHVKTALESNGSPQEPVLIVSRDWVQLNSQFEWWVDVDPFEQAVAAANGVRGESLDESKAKMLKEAVRLYRGDLLEGWYHDWCLFERERFQNMYLSVLDKLVNYSEVHSEYEAGLDFGTTILRYDPASERTHRQLMHLRYRSGDRTGALRQYERCVKVLDEELGVKPERSTTALYQQIRDSRLGDLDLPLSPSQSALSSVSAPEVLGLLKQLQSVLTTAQKCIQQDIQTIEQSLDTLKR